MSMVIYYASASVISFHIVAVNEVWSDSCVALGRTPLAQLLAEPLVLLALVLSSYSRAHALLLRYNRYTAHPYVSLWRKLSAETLVPRIHRKCFANITLFVLISKSTTYTTCYGILHSLTTQRADIFAKWKSIDWVILVALVEVDKII